MNRVHEHPQKYFHGCNVDILLIFFRLLIMQCKWTFANIALPFLSHKENAPYYGNSHKKCDSLAQQCFLFTHVCFHTV